MHVLIAGGGPAGLAMALTCHQVGVPVTVFEAVPVLKPLGVGINLQPNAVRELHDLGLGDRLDEIGIATREWALVGRNGNDIYTEPRGVLAGYRWPQYSVHRGRLQMLLYEAVCARLGPSAVLTGQRVVGYTNTGDGVRIRLEAADGTRSEAHGTVLIGADGIQSAVRAQMHPDQGEPHWGGAIMWRGTSPGRPIRSGASFVGLGGSRQRVVVYPISSPEPRSGLATINWIAEITVDPSAERAPGDWNRPVAVDSFVHHFAGWNYEWLDVPAMIRAADSVFVYPMIDRDPIPRWVDGRVALIGDAAHVMYPTGSNGASQGIVDARVLGARMLEHGASPAALLDYERRLREPISQLVLRNREAGPFGILNVVDERCGGVFDDIDAVMPLAEREAFMARYKSAAGLAIEQLNAAPPTIAPGARIGAGTP
ncbi:MAG: flavin-dependent oxidoreductase [Lautropia sp.]